MCGTGYKDWRIARSAAPLSCRLETVLQSVANLGGYGLDRLESFGRFWLFVARLIAWLPWGLFSPRSWRLLIHECYEIGVRSVMVIMVTGVFIGLVLAVQAVEQFATVGLEERMGVIVNLSLVRELGPVLAGVMLAGRVGGALTAELGTMNVTEQIEALRSMGTDPVRYLAVPRFLACFLLTPFLTFYCDVTGGLAGWWITVKAFGVPDEPYWYYTAVGVEWWDLFNGLVKSFFFGAVIGVVSCFKGFTCRQGAEGVGRACTESFVMCFIVILMLDFFIAYTLKELYEVIWGFKSVL